METVNKNPENAPDLHLNNEAKYYLYQSGRWAYFLGIVGFVVCLIMLLVALLMLGLPALSERVFSTLQTYAMGLMAMRVVLGSVYIVLALVYFFPSLYLYRFGHKIKYGLNEDIQISFIEALSNLKSVFKFWGIFTIVIISIYFISFFIPLIIALFSFSMIK